MDISKQETIQNYFQSPYKQVMWSTTLIFLICAICVLPACYLFVVVQLQEKMLQGVQDKLHVTEEKLVLLSNLEKFQKSVVPDNIRRRRSSTDTYNYLGNSITSRLQSKMMHIQERLRLAEQKISCCLNMSEKIERIQVIKRSEDIKGVLLHLAVVEDDLERVRLLIQLGANIEFQDEKEDRPIHQAARYSRYIILAELLSNRAQVNAPGNGSLTALHWTSYFGCIKCARSLLISGADTECKDNWRETALHKAASKGHLEVVMILLEMGANANAVNSGRASPLHLTTENGHCQCILLLLGKGANVDAQNSYGYTALHLAAKYGSVDCVNILLKEGAAIDKKTEGGNTALHLANAYEHQEVAELLIQRSARKDARNNQGKVPSQCISPRDL